MTIRTMKAFEAEAALHRDFTVQCLETQRHANVTSAKIVIAFSRITNTMHRTVRRTFALRQN